MNDVVTWKHMERHVTEKITVEVEGAPPWKVGDVTVLPRYVTLYIWQGNLTNIGIEGDLISGPGSRSGGRFAAVRKVAEAPAWARHLANEVL